MTKDTPSGAYPQGNGPALLRAEHTLPPSYGLRVPRPVGMGWAALGEGGGGNKGGIKPADIAAKSHGDGGPKR